MVQLLEMTPWWIYLLLAYFLLIGVRAAKPTIISLRKLAVVPLFFFGWSLYTLLSDLDNRYFFLIPWTLALLLGNLLGFFQVRRWPISTNFQKQTVSLPGSWSTLLLSISMFSLKYLFALLYATNPVAYKNPLIFGSDLVLTNLIAGIFLGRFWHFGMTLYQQRD